MSAQEPVARGSLAETPFAHLALYLYRRTARGTLVVDMPRGDRASIQFRDGRATAAQLSFYAQDLRDALLPLCGLNDGEYAFYESDLAQADDETITGVIDPYELLVASLVDHARDDMVEAVLQRYAASRLRLQPGRDLERLGLKAADKPLIEIVRAAPALPEELIAQSPLPKLRSRRLVYALIVTHTVSPHEDRTTDVFKSQVDARSVRPGFSAVNEVASSPGPRAWKLLASLRPATPSSRPAVSMPPQAAVPRQPVSVKPTPTSVKPVQASLRPAQPTMRPAMTHGSAPPLSSRDTLRETLREPLVDERTARLRKAEQLLQRSKIDDALVLIEEALAAEPSAAELHALKGHALFEKHRHEPDGLPRVVVESLRKALELDDEQARAHYVKGLVYQRGGDVKKAVAAWKRVLQLDPKHLDAQRAVRLAKLRDTLG